MTYCLGIYLRDGFVLSADSRTNAGVDQIALVRKLSTFITPGERVLAVMSAGNLATTQAVVTLLQQRFQTGQPGDLATVATMFDGAQVIGNTLREIMDRDGNYVRPYGSPDASFIFAGEIAGGAHRLFEIYSAGNFVEATPETPFMQIGETKYGKPILDRMLTFESNLLRASKCAVLSMDATIRSNLTVAPPIDLVRYKAASLQQADHLRFTADDPFLTGISKGFSDGLQELFNTLPNPPWPQ